ncbi:hypothetical protein D3C74_460580 [compost metagenome]
MEARLITSLKLTIICLPLAAALTNVGAPTSPTESSVVYGRITFFNVVVSATPEIVMVLVPAGSAE